MGDERIVVQENKERVVIICLRDLAYCAAIWRGICMVFPASSAAW